jgi:hypothetical protein
VRTPPLHQHCLCLAVPLWILIRGLPEPMLQIIALTQFIFLALGSMGVTVLLKASGYPIGSERDYPALSLFLMQNSVWLLLVPVLWSAFAYSAQKIERGFVSSKVAIPLGIGLAVLIFVTYGSAIIGHF